MFDGGVVRVNDFDYIQTYGTSAFVQTLHISMHHVKSMEVTHPMCEMLLLFSTGVESSVVYDQHEGPVGF